MPSPFKPSMWGEDPFPGPQASGAGLCSLASGREAAQLWRQPRLFSLASSAARRWRNALGHRWMLWGDRKGRVGCHDGIKETLKINLHSHVREHPGASAELKMDPGGVGRALPPAQCVWPRRNIRGVGVIAAQARGFRVSFRSCGSEQWHVPSGWGWDRGPCPEHWWAERTDRSGWEAGLALPQRFWEFVCDRAPFQGFVHQSVPSPALSPAPNFD